MPSPPRTALVTGAGQGVGLGIAQRLANPQETAPASMPAPTLAGAPI